MRTARILLLEDDLETLSKLLNGIHKLEATLADSKTCVIAVTVFSEYTQVEDYLNKMSANNYDVILLDRDCKLGGSFHTLDLKKFAVDKVISISSIPEYNQEAKLNGVKRIVHKDYSKLDEFTESVLEQIKELLIVNP